MEQYDWEDKNILIIENDPLNIKLFKDYFRKFSKSNIYIITDVTKLKQKLKNFEEIDLVVADIKLPNGDIFPHLEEIKKQLNCKIILQSAFYLQYDKRNFKNVYEWFSKPISFENFFDTIDKIFKE